jgi:hypothetical protein
MALALVLESLNRIEHKLDAVLRHFQISATPLQFTGTICPACKQLIKYEVNITHGVVYRSCGCSTGKVAIPVTPGVENGSASSSGRGKARRT